MKSFLDKRIHLVFWALFVICYIASWYGLLFLLAIFYSLSFYYFRQKQLDYGLESNGDNRVIVSPVSGKLISVSPCRLEEDSTQEVNCLIIRVAHWNDFGIFSPINAEIKDLSKKLGLAQFRYRKIDSQDYGATRLVLEDKQNIKIVLEFIQCTLGLLPQLKVLAGDRAKLRANLGHFPFGGTVKVYVPKGVGVIAQAGEELVSGETILGELEQLEDNNE